MLTTLCAGIHPDRTLPVVLDCGTNNEKLLNDDLYLGLKEKRVRGDEYDKFVDKFVTAARKLYPRAYVHFEDFGLTNGKPPPPAGLPGIGSGPRLTNILQPAGSSRDTARRSLVSTTTCRAPAA